MNGSVYADTSWLAKLYLYEAESADCIAYLSLIAVPYVSQLSDVEVTAAISKSHGASQGSAAQALALYREDCNLGLLKRLLLDERVFAEAVNIAEHKSAGLFLRSLDTIHIATARRYGISTIASFDKRLRQTASAMGLQVLPV